MTTATYNNNIQTFGCVELACMANKNFKEQIGGRVLFRDHLCYMFFTKYKLWISDFRFQKYIIHMV